jgi:hypothetical protein
MVFISKTVRTGMAATLLLAGIAVGAHGDVGGIGASFGPPGVDAVQLRGRVLCTSCSLEEVRQTQRHAPGLYQLSHKQGQLVMQINWISNASRWQRVVWPPRVWLRGEASLLLQLSAEANLFRELEIEGTLSNTRTFDITSLTRTG